MNTEIHIKPSFSSRPESIITHQCIPSSHTNNHASPYCPCLCEFSPITPIQPVNPPSIDEDKSSFLQFNSENYSEMLRKQKIDYQTEILKLQQENFEVKKLNFLLNTQLHSISQAKESTTEKELKKKQEKIKMLKKELENVKKSYFEELKIVQNHAAMSLKEIVKDYKEDVGQLRDRIRELEEEKEKMREERENDIREKITEVLHKEKKKIYKYVSKIKSQRNEAFAKLEVSRRELKTLTCFFDKFDQKVSHERVENIRKVLEQDRLTNDDVDWVLGSLCFIEEDLLRLETRQKLNTKIIAEKEVELQESRSKLSFSLTSSLMNSKRTSPQQSKPQTHCSSPVNSTEASFFPLTSPRIAGPSYNILEDAYFRTQEKVKESQDIAEMTKIINELTNLKLKYALLQEYIGTRDNDFYLIIKEIYKIVENKEPLYQKCKNLLDLMISKIKDTTEMLNN